MKLRADFTSRTQMYLMQKHCMDIARRLFRLMILVCVLRLGLPGEETTDIHAEVVIRALEQAWFEGQLRNDNHALGLILDNGLVYIEYGELITKGEYLSRIRTATPIQSQIVMEPITVRLFGGAAIVVGAYRETGLHNGKARIRRWRFVDTWVNKGGHWMLVAAAAAPVLK
jgi:hypothetical protein